MKILDSLSNELKDLADGSGPVKIYLCGPTVYDDVHIGNIFPVIIFDFIIRYLKTKQIKHIYIHNITDIDDKIVQRSQELKISEEQLANKYKKRYFQILKNLNIISPNIMPQVSDHIQDIQSIIKQLIENKFAYEKNGDVLFKISKNQFYGELSKQKLESLINGSDFCLWKQITNGKTWDSPWGKGRPGWHTECFAFIHKYFQGPIDIHGGGMDLKFPHHENENAHGRAIYKKCISRIWMHVGHVSTQEGKISKSSNNKYLVKDLLKTYSPNLIRYLCLINHYSSPYLISDEKIQIANKECNDLQLTINKARSFIYLQEKNFSESTNSYPDKELIQLIENNLNLPKTITLMQSWKKQLLSNIKKNNLEKVKQNYEKLMSNLLWMGFTVENNHSEQDLIFLKTWKKECQKKNWKVADEIRNKLIKNKLI